MSGGNRKNSNLGHLCKNWSGLRKSINESPARPLLSGQDIRKPRSKRHLSSDDVTDMVHRYDAGETTQQIGNRYGISKTRVATVLREQDITIRRQGLNESRILFPMMMDNLYYPSSYSRGQCVCSPWVANSGAPTASATTRRRRLTGQVSRGVHRLELSFMPPRIKFSGSAVSQVARVGTAESRLRAMRRSMTNQ